MRGVDRRKPPRARPWWETHAWVKKRRQPRQQFPQSAGTVADAAFDGHTKLGERAVIFHDLEQGIVAEPGRTARLEQDAAVAFTPGLGDGFARGIGQYRITNVVRFACGSCSA